MERLWIPIIVTFFSFGGLLLGGAVGVATRQLIEEKDASLIRIMWWDFAWGFIT